MTELGVGIAAATVTILVAEYLRCRRGPLPAYGWLGLAALAIGEVLTFRHVEPMATYFTPFAWTAYILAADAAVLSLTGRSRLRDAPAELARVALLSIPLWLIFEAYNLRLKNWTYVGVPKEWFPALIGYGWSFATILPAIFETADLVESFRWFRRAPPVEFSATSRHTLAVCGALCLVIPLAVPSRAAAYLFGLVWVGFLLLLDPQNYRIGLPSLLGDLAEGRRSRLYSLLAAGWVCGWLWEFWNFWATAKWHYTFPIFQREKIFEMPAPGYLGFLPFALECFVLYVTAAWLAGWLKRSS